MSKLNGTVPNKVAVDLGIAIGAATLLPGQTRTQHDIKCFIDAAIEVLTHTKRTISAQRVQQIENKALRKLRHSSKLKLLQ